MILKTKRYKTAFTTVPNDPINNRELSYEALGVWLSLMSKPDDWQVKMKDLQNRTKPTGRKYGRDAMRGILKELEAAGLAELVTGREEDGSLSGTFWVISDSPSTEGRKNRRSEIPTVGKSDPLLKKELNTNKRVERENPIPAAEIPNESSVIDPDFDPSQYIVNVLEKAPRTTIDRWCMNTRIDEFVLWDQVEAFAVWYFSTLSERMGEDDAIKTIAGLKLRSLCRIFENKFLRNYKEKVA